MPRCPIARWNLVMKIAPVELPTVVRSDVSKLPIDYRSVLDRPPPTSPPSPHLFFLCIYELSAQLPVFLRGKNRSQVHFALVFPSIFRYFQNKTAHHFCSFACTTPAVAFVTQIRGAEVIVSSLGIYTPVPPDEKLSSKRQFYCRIRVARLTPNILVRPTFSGS